MPNPKNVHVTYDKQNDHWKVKTEGAARAAGYYDTKLEAKAAGRTVAENKSGELFVHDKKNGQIAERDSYGNDPFPPRDKD